MLLVHFEVLLTHTHIPQATLVLLTHTHIPQAATERRTEGYELKAQRAAETIALLKKGIFDMFEAIGCNDEGLTAILGKIPSLLITF